MTAFLHGVLQRSPEFEPSIISLATSVSDSASVGLRRPRSWFRGPQVETRTWRGIPYRHVGACLPEIEPRRYRPRAIGDQLLQEYDLVQFVLGTPPFLCMAERLRQPVLLWTATTVRTDRASQLRAGPIHRQLWYRFFFRRIAQLEARALARADRVFVLSHYTRETLRKNGYNRGVVVAPCGVDTSKFLPAPAPGPQSIVSVGRFSDVRKNVGLLFRAYAALCQLLPECPRLVVVGDAPSDDVLRMLQLLGIADKVYLTGPKSGDELVALYQQASVFALASNEEGLGIVILEAMACGLPIVSTDCGGPRTAVDEGRNGLLTPVGDADALTRAMHRLITNPELRANMGLESRRRAEALFSLESVGETFLSQYRTILSSPRSTDCPPAAPAQIRGEPSP